MGYFTLSKSTCYRQKNMQSHTEPIELFFNLNTSGVPHIKRRITQKNIHEELHPHLPFFLYSFEPYTKEYRKSASLKNTCMLFLCFSLIKYTREFAFFINKIQRTRQDAKWRRWKMMMCLLFVLQR